MDADEELSSSSSLCSLPSLSFCGSFSDSPVAPPKGSVVEELDDVSKMFASTFADEAPDFEVAPDSLLVELVDEELADVLEPFTNEELDDPVIFEPTLPVLADDAASELSVFLAPSTPSFFGSFWPTDSPTVFFGPSEFKSALLVLLALT